MVAITILISHRKPMSKRIFIKDNAVNSNSLPAVMLARKVLLQWPSDLKTEAVGSFVNVSTYLQNYKASKAKT